VLRRHSGAQPTDLQRAAPGSTIRALPELPVGREPEATVTVGGTPIVLFTNSIGRQTVAGHQLAELQQTSQTVSCHQDRFGKQHRIVVVEFVV